MVLFDVVEAMDDPERMVVRVPPGVVWLPSPQFLPKLRREILQRSGAPGAVIEDREVHSLDGGDQRMGNVVERGSQGVGDLTCDNPESVLRCVQIPEAVQVEAALYIEAVGDAVFVSLDASASLDFQVFEVFLRPIQSGIPSSPNRHEVRSLHRIEANDPEGRGNPGPPKGRLGEGSPPSAEPEGLNYRPPA